MDAFIDWLMPVLALCVGVAFLSVFFGIYGAIKDKVRGSRSISMQEISDELGPVTVLTNRGEKFDNVKLIGIGSPIKGGNLPFPLSNMLVLVDQEQKKVFLKLDTIRSIQQTQQKAQHPIA